MQMQLAFQRCLSSYAAICNPETEDYGCPSLT